MSQKNFFYIMYSFKNKELQDILLFITSLSSLSEDALQTTWGCNSTLYWYGYTKLGMGNFYVIKKNYSVGLYSKNKC